MQQLIHIVHSTIVRQNHARPTQKFDRKSHPNRRKIEPKPARIHPDSTLQHQIHGKSTPEPPRVDFLVIFGGIWEAKIERKSLKLHKNPKNFLIVFLDANL